MIQFSPQLPKAPGEGLKLSMDFSQAGWLAAGESIATCVWSCQVYEGVDPHPEAMLSGTATINGAVVSQQVVGGLEDVVYLLLATITTTPARPAPLIGRALLRVATTT